MPIRLVCFDLGGVLVKICRSWSDGCRAAGLDVRGNSAGDRAGALRRDLNHRLGLGELSEDEWAEQLSEALGRLYSASEIKRIHRAWSQTEYPGALALIDALNERGLDTGCLSNTNHAHWTRLVHHDGSAPLSGEPEYPAVHRLRHRHASHLLRLAKPDPAIYRAFERATARAPEEILFFDDLPENVAAARALGWQAVRVNPHADTVGQIRERLRSFDVVL
ncbi:MAG TPA: HAD family phosphatase [Polyangiaceae bacterium]|nr:HAD family phosphatase [Polyangiaceae bacterium]